MLEQRKSLELKKHVGAIHSSNGLTLIQRKLANGLLYNAYDDLMAKDEYKISIKDLCELIGYDSNDYKTIKKALLNLLSTVIEWNLIDGDNSDADGIWNASSIIADASIEGSVCTYSYSKRMKQLLHRPEIYGRLNMTVQAKFKSSYGLALYENCIRYQNLASTPWLDFMVFRRLMGVEEGKYPIFRDFKRRVLDKAVADVNCYAPIQITPNLRKSNRKIMAIRFMIKRVEPQTSKQLSKPEVSLSDRLITDFGLSKSQATELIQQYEASFILEKITLIEASISFKQGKIFNLTNYLIDALAKDYQPVKNAKERVGEGGTVINAAQAQENALFAQQQEKLQLEYERYIYRQILEQYEQVDVNSKKQIREEFEQYLGEGGYLEIFHRVGLTNTIIADKFCFFIKATRPDFRMKLISFEDYVRDKNLLK